MTPEKYQRLSDLFTHGCELSANDRRVLLDDTARQDPELHDELERLFRLDSADGLGTADEQDNVGHEIHPAGSCPAIPGYVIRELLGEGGMGQVWRATQLSTQREVALKLIHGLRLTSSQNRARFEREVELMARLSHPNVARVFDSGFADGYAYYTMESVDGQPLDEYIRACRPGELARIELMTQVCRGVQHAHQRGVIHRDLKPSNVLVTPQGQPIVVDFGLAKCIGKDSAEDRHLTRGILIGTPEYMSPEQAAGGMTQVDTRSDVYSLGVILYWLLTHRLPYDLPDSDDRLTLLRHVASNEIRPPRSVAPELDPGLVAILEKALAREPNDRYSGVGGFADDLQRHLDGEPVTAASAGWTYVLKRRLYKHRKTALLTLLIFGGFVGAVAGFVAMAHRHARVALALAQRAEESQRVTRQAERRALRMAYIHQLALANNETTRFQYQRAKFLLEDCPPDQRGWEWQLMLNLATPPDQSEFAIGPFDTPVRRLAFSPDGRWLALGTSRGTTTALPDPTLWVCNATTGAIVSQLHGHTDGIFALAFTPDGHQLLTGSRDHTLRRWDVQTGALLETFAGPLPGTTGAEEMIAFEIRFSPDGTMLALAAYPQGLYLADVGPEFSWRSVLENATHVRYCSGEDDALAFTPDGQQLAWSTRLWQGNIGHLFLVDTKQRQVLAHRELPPGEPCYSIDFHPLNATILTGDLRQSATLYSADLSQPMGKFLNESGTVRRAYFTADGMHVLTLAPRGSVCQWNSLTHQIESVIQAPNDLQSWEMALSTDRSLMAVATGAPAYVRVWKVAQTQRDRRVLAVHPPKARDVAVHPAGTHIATCGDDGKVNLYRWPKRELLHTFACELDSATAVAFSPEGRQLAVASSVNPNVRPQPPFGRVEVFDVESGQPAAPPIPIPGWVWNVEFDASGTRLIVADGVTLNLLPTMSASAYIFNWTTGERSCTVSLPEARCRDAVITPDGQTLITASESRLACWNAVTGQRLVEHICSHGRNFIRLLPETNQILTGNEAAVEIRQLPGLELIRTFEQSRDFNAEETNLVGDAIVRWQDKSLVSGSWNGTLTIWDLETAHARLTLPAHDTGVHCLQFDPDRQVLFSAGHDGSVRVWDGRPANR